MSNFKFFKTGTPGVLLAEPAVHGDARGFFMETWRQDEFAQAGIPGPFVQDNHSASRRGVLRGLHFQRENTQGKLVRVLRGAVFDVAVDLRPNSPCFGRWAGAELNDENRLMLYAPPGFGHAFLVLSDTAEFAYKCTDLYSPAFEGGVRWDDPDIGVRWPNAGIAPQLSAKDAALPFLKDQSFTFFERWYTG